MKKLNDYEFDYIFYDSNKMQYLDLAIGAINKVHKDDSGWISKQITQLTTAFVLKSLSSFQQENLRNREFKTHVD